MANIQNLTAIDFGGAQPASERPLLTFVGTQLQVTLADGTAGGSFGLGQIGGLAVTGTDTAGNNVIVSGGPSTGSGAPGDVLIQTAPAGSTGSTVNTLVNRVLVQGTRIPLVTTVAKTIFSITLPASAGTGGKVFYSIYASDGTDFQVRTASCNFAVVNKATTITADTDIDAATSIAASTGTLTATAAMTTTSPTSNFQITATTSLTPTSFFIDYVLIMNGAQACSLATS